MKKVRWDDRYDIKMIPKALKQARSVQPDPSIEPMWQGQVYRDIEENRPSNWKKFVSLLANEVRAVLP